jgi:hypothetical protein
MDAGPDWAMPPDAFSISDMTVANRDSRIERDDALSPDLESCAGGLVSCRNDV